MRISTDTPSVEFEIIHRHGIWTVTKDHRFFGDYTRLQFALETILDAIAKIFENGGAAHLLNSADYL
jgi:hypothetical protein